MQPTDTRFFPLFGNIFRCLGLDMRSRGKSPRPDLGMRNHGFWYLFVDHILIYCMLGCAFICLRVYMRAWVRACVCVRVRARACM